MGKLVVTIGVGDQQGRQFEDLEVTVDTGSTFTAVPRALLQRLGVPVRRSARSRLADGSSVPVDIGWTVVRLEDQIFATQVIFAEENQPSLLGVVTLEDALLAVDPVGQRLVPVEAERSEQWPAAITWTPSLRTGSSPSATQGAGSTTPRKASASRPWWTKNRSGTTRRTKTGPVGSASITGSGDGPIVRGWRGSSSPVRGGQSRSLADTVDLLGRREHNVVNFAVTG